MSQPSKLHQLCVIALYLQVILASTQILALGYPNEACGIVTKVVDGDTFEVTVERGDQRISSGVERVRLADVDSPEIDTDRGIEARDLATAILLNRRVYLDIDDYAGRDSYGRLVCAVYLSGYYDQPISVPCFNRILIDSGLADVEDFSDNEFNPDDWWRGSRSYSYESSSGLQAVSSDGGAVEDRRGGYEDAATGDLASGDLASDGAGTAESDTTDSGYGYERVSSSGSSSSKSDLERIAGDFLHMLYNEVLKELGKRAAQAAQ